MENKIEYRMGDVIEAAIQCENNVMIPHICNTIGVWGGGFTGALSRKWEMPERRYRSWYTLAHGSLPLDEIQLIQVTKNIQVINMIAQKGIGYTGQRNPPIRYDALTKCLTTVAEEAVTYGASVYAPRFGAGLAGGHWGKIEQIINDTLVANGIPVFIYDLK